MPIYDANAQARLINKLDYELWLLEYLSKVQDSAEGGTDISTIKLTNKGKVLSESLSFTDHLGADYAQGVMDAMAPLTFSAAYKVLDMVHEWILEENQADNVIKKVPWKFKDKMDLITKTKTQLKYPPLVIAHPYLFDGAFALFTNLLPYRNEIVHKHNFSVSADKIILEDTKAGSKLELDREELGFFVRFVIALAKCLAGKLAYDQYVDRLFRFHLDQLTTAHRLPPFGQKQPLRVHVELTVPQEDGKYFADLKSVRDKVNQMHPGSDVLFSLTIIATTNGDIFAKWNIPLPDVPADDIVEFTDETYPSCKEI